MELVYFIVALIALCAIFGLIHVTIYNSLQNKKIKIDEAEAVIDEELRNRYDYIIRSIELIKSIVKLNPDYFKEFEDIKNKKISNFDLDRKIREMISTLTKLKHDYPSIDKNREIKSISKQLISNEEKLEAAKTFYNKYTTELNTVIRKFPSNIVAKLHGYIIRPFFDGKNLEDDDTKDFKL